MMPIYEPIISLLDACLLRPSRLPQCMYTCTDMKHHDGLMRVRIRVRSEQLRMNLCDALS